MAAAEHKQGRLVRCAPLCPRHPDISSSSDKFFPDAKAHRIERRGLAESE
jgi:hypothetical protein